MVRTVGFGHRFSPAGSPVDPASFAFAQSGILTHLFCQLVYLFAWWDNITFPEVNYTTKYPLTLTYEDIDSAMVRIGSRVYV